MPDPEPCPGRTPGDGIASQLLRWSDPRWSGHRPRPPGRLSTRRAAATTCASHPTDDLQGAALALFARERGRKRVFVARRRQCVLRRPDGNRFRDIVAQARPRRSSAAPAGTRRPESYAQHRGAGGALRRDGCLRRRTDRHQRGSGSFETSALASAAWSTSWGLTVSSRSCSWSKPARPLSVRT